VIFIKNHYYQVYTEPELKHLFGTKPIQLQEVIISAYSNEKNKEFDNLKIRVFVSHDGVKLLQQYKKVQIYDNELALFIELNDKNNFNGSILKVKAGNDLEKMKNFPMKEILAFAKQQAVNMDAKTVKKLLEQAHRSKKGVFYWFTNLMSKIIKNLVAVPLFLSKTLAKTLGNAFFKTIPNMLDNLRLKDKDWNPANKNYDPIFIPQSIIDAIEKNKHSDKIYDQLITDFFKPFHIMQTTITGGSVLLGTLGQMPVQHKTLTLKLLDNFFEQVFSVENFFKRNKNDFWQLLQTGIEAVNAFFVGLSNSIIDTLKGIFQLLGLVFLGIHALMQPDEFSYYTELAGEMLENLVETILKLNFDKIYQEFVKFGIKIFDKLKDFAQNFSFSIQKIAYFLGYILGFIIETIISILFTGGALDALTIEQVLTETFVAPLTSLLKGLRKTISKAKNLFEKIYIFVKKVLEKLKNPKQALKELFEVVMSLFRTKDPYVKKVDNVIEELEKNKTKLDEIIDGNGKVKKLHKKNYKRYGNLGEMVADAHWLQIKKWSNGEKVNFKLLHKPVQDLDDAIVKGIDAIYQNTLFKPPPPPPKYVINEVKYSKKANLTKSKWKAKISKTVTKSKGTQMSKKWIKYNLDFIIDEELLKYDILDNYSTFLTGVTKKGKSVEIFELSKDLKTIKKIKL